LNYLLWVLPLIGTGFTWLLSTEVWNAMSTRHPAHFHIWLFNSLSVRSHLKHAQQGFTLAETLIVIVVVGILATISAPMWMERPLRQGAQQSGSLFRQVRMRAMSNTTAFRIRPDLTSVVAGTTPPRATRFLVQASSGRTCGARTNISNVDSPVVSDASSILPVDSVANFNLGDRVTVGESTVTYEVTAKDSGTSRIVVGGTQPGSEGDALRGAEVELASVWRAGGQFTGVLNEQLILASGASEAAAIPTEVEVNGQNIPWSMCYSAQGLATFFNARTGQVVNSDLALPVVSCKMQSNCAGAGMTGTATVSVSRGGSVAVEF
jgi:prepilin-type N-terminal cleavage/methylation domain-containing protein